MRLTTKGRINKIGKIVTPYLGRMAACRHVASVIDLTSAYLNFILGKGAGTGWDKGEELAASKFINTPEPVILDIGANYGEWTQEMRRLIGERGLWILVEPASKCCERLRTFKSVEVLQVAVGEKVGTAQLYSPNDGSVLGSLYFRQDTFIRGQKLEAYEVAVVTIDEILDERRIKVVDFAKMDLEGHELFALRGAEQSLRTHRIRALSFEFGSSNVNSRTYFRDFWDLLTKHNYRIERICPGGKTIPVMEYYEDLEYFMGATNYIAVANTVPKFEGE